MKRYIHPFEPIIDENSKVLILGTFPSLDSFFNNFYYAHKKNQFWKIMEELFDLELKRVDEKKQFLKEKKIALWDMIKSCKRKNSSDTNLKDIEVNDIKALLKKYPNIKFIAFTSKKAQSLYEKNFDLGIPTIYLPSPSPAYASMKFSEKVKKYQILKKFV